MDMKEIVAREIKRLQAENERLTKENTTLRTMLKLLEA